LGPLKVPRRKNNPLKGYGGNGPHSVGGVVKKIRRVPNQRNSDQLTKGEKKQNDENKKQSK